MKHEYIIINKTAIQKRIEELEKAQKENPLTAAIWGFAKDELQKVLSQSTPLIPEIEKAFDAGDNYRYCENNGSRSIPSDVLDKNEYTSNLKLDI